MRTGATGSVAAGDRGGGRPWRRAMAQVVNRREGADGSSDDDGDDGGGASEPGQLGVPVRAKRADSSSRMLGVS